MKAWLACALGWLACAAMVGCAVPEPGGDSFLPPPSDAGETASASCSVAANDGPPALAESATRLADRGIGGTGVSTDGPDAPPPTPDGPLAPVDRGVGGTGIAGVITGFASICVNGLEVHYAETTPVQRDDGGAASADGLRAGELAVIGAADDGGDLRANSVAVRHEVIGPVDRVEADGVLVVLGQRVRVDAATRGNTAATVGAFVAVSGLRDEAGVIAATRVEVIPPGPAVVHGMLSQDALGPHIGALRLRVSRDVRVPPDGPVTASGVAFAGGLDVAALVPDLVLSDPGAAFGPGVSIFFIESFGAIDGGYHGPVVLNWRRAGDGRLRRVGVRTAQPMVPAAHGAAGPGRGREGSGGRGLFPAPIGPGLTGTNTGAGYAAAPVPRPGDRRGAALRAGRGGAGGALRRGRFGGDDRGGAVGPQPFGGGGPGGGGNGGGGPGGGGNGPGGPPH